MSVKVIVGAQWGDEGKGKMIDYFARNADVVVRFQGGDNIGHTVINSAGTFKLHIIPCGVFKSNCLCFCGTGMVINPDVLIDELADIESKSVSADNVFISAKATILMPYHVELDRLSEGMNAIGRTKRGIGLAYTDRAKRLALRFEDLFDLEYCAARLDQILPNVNAELKNKGAKAFAKADILKILGDWAVKLEKRIVEPVKFINDQIKEDKKIVFEGQLGIMMDIDYGSYPFVTASNPTASYAAVSGGFSAKKIDKIIGVMKAFSSTTGRWPLITEMTEEETEKFKKIGPDDESPAPGNNRSIGWLDLAVVRYAALINGFDELALCHIDKLDHLNEIKVCVGYKLNGKDIDYMPSIKEQLHAEPIYEVIQGWMISTKGIDKIKDLPVNARKYIELIEKVVGVPIKYVGVGPGRSDIAI
ncbi:MAG: adenylosuccinate synthase [Firmicutes bacterium]|nr:adenylosuccinate synthase [Bacillota bacterium]